MNIFAAAGSAIHAVSHAVSHMVEHIDHSNRIWVTLSQHAYVGGDIVAGTVEMVGLTYKI